MTEALHICLTLHDQRFDRDVSLELPGGWIATLKTMHARPPSIHNSGLLISSVVLEGTDDRHHHGSHAPDFDHMVYACKCIW